MSPNVPKLHFNEGKETGFAGHLSTFDGSPEPILRELLQNSLDAAHTAGRDVCEVTFVLADVPADQIAGIDDYRAKFTSTLDYRERSREALVTDETRTINRIKAMLDRDRVPVLLCVDNGVGLDEVRMSNLLTEGNSTKGGGGAGSFGIGHLSAFAGSDLRYVLYGSRFGSDASPSSLFSGHAVLASDLQTDERGKFHRSADGFLVRSGVQRALFGAADGNEYVTDVPDYIARHLPANQTGTAVAVAGFNYFHDDIDIDGFADVVCAVAAANFTCALADGRMTVNVVDDTTDAKRVVGSVEQSNVESVLDATQDSANGEHFTWSEAKHALSAMNSRPLEFTQLSAKDNRSLEFPQDDDQGFAGVRAHVTQVTDGAATRRVIVYRKGMAITKDMRLWQGKFSAARPFVAAVRLDDGELERLVRDSENPQHLGIQKRNLEPADRTRLNALLSKLGDVIAAEVGVADDDDRFIPDDVADDLFQSLFTERSARREPAFDGGEDLHEEDDSDGEPNTTAEQEGGEGSGGEDEPDEPGEGNTTPLPAQAPKGGKRILCASTIGGLSDDRTSVSVAIELRADPRISSAGVRLRVCSPTDHTSIRVEQPRYLTPLELTGDGVSVSLQPAGADYPKELRWVDAAQQRSLTGTLTFAKPYTGDPQLLELEVVKRSASAAR